MAGHLVVFFVASFVGFLAYRERRNPIGTTLFAAVPIVAVYFVGWAALATHLAGFAFGVYLAGQQRR